MVPVTRNGWPAIAFTWARTVAAVVLVRLTLTRSCFVLAFQVATAVFVVSVPSSKMRTIASFIVAPAVVAVNRRSLFAPGDLITTTAAAKSLPPELSAVNAASKFAVAGTLALSQPTRTSLNRTLIASRSLVDRSNTPVLVPAATPRLIGTTEDDGRSVITLLSTPALVTEPAPPKKLISSAASRIWPPETTERLASKVRSVVVIS